MSRPNWRKGLNNSVSSSASNENALTLPDSLSNTIESVQNADPKKSTVYVFYHTAIDFARKLHEWYPEEKSFKDFLDQENEKYKTLDVKTEFDVVEGADEYARLIHQLFSNHYSTVLSKNTDFFKLDVFESFHAYDKYMGATEDQKEKIWECFRNLIQYSSMVNMYAKVPSTMLSTIKNMAGSLVEKIQTGDVDFSNLNPMQIGEMMMKDIDTKDIENFGRSLLEEGNIENLMAMMQSTLSNSNMGNMMDLLKKQ